MARNPLDTPLPTALPVLSHGKHRNPDRGACFMEYTSVLAGEPFTDSPRCVDAELAAVLRGANDMLSDTGRPAMVPMLGRAIGLVVPVPDHPAGRSGFRLRPRRHEADDPSVARTAALRRDVARRLVGAVLQTPDHPRWHWYSRHTRVSRVFWELMDEPALAESSPAYAERLVERLDLLHRCYEEAMRDLGLPRVATAPAATDGVAPPLDAAPATVPEQ